MKILNKSYENRITALASHLINGMCKAGNASGCRRTRTADDSVLSISQRICAQYHTLYMESACDLRLHTLSITGRNRPVAADRKKQCAEMIAAYPTENEWVTKDFSTKDGFFHSSLFWRETNLSYLSYLGKHHGVPMYGVMDDRRQAIFHHVAGGDCLKGGDHFHGCRAYLSGISSSQPSPSKMLLYALEESLKPNVVVHALTSILQLYGVEVPQSVNKDGLIMSVEALIRSTRKSLFALEVHEARKAMDAREVSIEALRQSWPHTPSKERKDELLAAFRNATSTRALAESPCAVCGQNYPTRLLDSHLVDSLPLCMLSAPSRRAGAWQVPSPMEGHPTLSEYILEPRGVKSTADGTITLDMCSSCSKDLTAGNLPRCALANSIYAGPVPEELAGLTPMEESLIARCRAKCTIVQLQYQGKNDPKDEHRTRPDLQRAIKGNIVTFPQHPTFLPSLLPPPIEEIVQYVCVVFIGSQMPEKEWFETYATPLAVRPDRIRRALEWLKANNRLYADIELNEDCLRQLPTDGRLLPFHYELVDPSEARDSATSRYDSNENSSETRDGIAQGNEIPFSTVVMSNVGENTKSNELREAAAAHLRVKKAPVITMPHDPTFANEFDNPALFPSLYPTLFPYGLGGFEDATRRHTLSLKNHVRCLLSLADDRFRVHRSFLFTAFNILQRRSMLRSVAFKTRHSWFRRIAEELNGISAELLERVTVRSESDTWAVDARTEEEVKAFQLMNNVHSVTRMVDGSNSGRLSMRNEIRGQTITQGVPNIFATINPADVHNPIIKLLAGADIDVDNLLPEQVPQYWEQARLVSRNPIVAAKFFDAYIKTFLNVLLAYRKPTLNEYQADAPSRIGAFGIVRGYYGCVEAQGRGTLHVHFVFWTEGAPNPNELRTRLMDAHDIAFRQHFTAHVEDLIHNETPPLPQPDVAVLSDDHNPCTVRGVPLHDAANSTPAHRAKDLRNVVIECQTHEHRATCWKFWKGPGYPKECRFQLDESSVIPASYVDPKSGEFTLRRVEGMINNYNPLTLQALRNNMDIKYIASGNSAKAAMFYITDYISKGQLKTHVALSALQAAMTKVEAIDTHGDTLGLEPVARGKRVLQKCAYEMLSRQELSAPQVASYLMDFGDHYASHSFRCLFWTAAERFVDECIPSPECRGGVAHHLEKAKVVDPEDSSDASESDDGSDGTLEDGDTPPLDDDITLESGSDGFVRARASQLRDYIYRGGLFTGLSFWDFVSRATKHKYTRSPLFGLNKQGVEDSEDLWTGFDVFGSATTTRPSASFEPEHDEVETAYISLTHPLEAFIPVPIGPSLPRRDQPEVWSRYCRLMLILFKPWRTAKDLRGDAETWVEAFDLFQSSPLCTPRIVKILENMQVFHECKDSRDEHFRSRSRKLADFGADIISRGEYQAEEENLFTATAEEDDSAFLHLLKSSSRNKDGQDRVQSNISEVLQLAARCGILQSSNMEGYASALEGVTSTQGGHVCVTGGHEDLEVVWKDEYQRRREQRRIQGRPKAKGMPTRTGPRTGNPPALDPSICAPLSGSNHDELRQRIIKKFTLSREQALAFQIITAHVAAPRVEPLRLYVGGAAGTGKTQVVNALKDLFHARKENQRYVLASYMGVAARNIGGTTLHSALNLYNIETMAIHGQIHHDLIKDWDGKDWLIVDEVSMVSLNLMQLVSRGLQLAKESDKAFGGVNVVFLGDFAQLPPVAQPSLFKKLSGNYMSGTSQGQKSIHGKLLWYSLNAAVILQQPQRQAGKDNVPFVDLLSRLRDGACTRADQEMLNSKIMNPKHAPLFHNTTSPWKLAPILVAENATKDALNEACAIQFAIDHKQELHWYYSTDVRRGKEVSGSQLFEELQARTSGETKQRLGRIPLCIGMPVLVAQNWDVLGGVVNGSRGTVKTIRYKMNSQGRRVLTSVVVTIEGCNSECMTSLNPLEMPILCDSVALEFRRKGSPDKMNCQRKQVAIVPAFAMTAHRAQGQTMSHVIVDLDSCSTPEAAYVMVSRATSLDGLMVLRPFRPDVLTMGKSEQYQVETHRLHVLSLKTTAHWGDADDSAFAQAELERLGNADALTLPENNNGGKKLTRLVNTGRKRFLRNVSSAGAMIDKLQSTALASYRRRDQGRINQAKRRPRICRVDI